MPELPEVETIKEALNKSICGAKINSVLVNNRSFREKIPEDFESITKNTTITKIWRLAKYAILNLSNGYSIIWHFGMSGKVKILSENTSVYEKHDHVIFQTSKGVVIFNDTRRFGLISYCKTNELMKHHLFSEIGIDPFDKNFDVQYLASKLKNKKTPIKISLLDQKIVSGIGNIYASEALYKAQISPLRETSSLTLDEIENLIKAIQFTLEKAIKAGGSTLRDYKKPDGSMGYFQNEHCVYNKTGQRCPNCVCDLNSTSGIVKITQGGRSTFYCSTLQK
ncbi:MAG: bifunctional DNA-formamidopyrimidine glycosylase/DNA-(apurinic or apyrimidinic site) lyase [Alphaproteobacteria bacterium]|nr:bifunctional DNA-formamidopyrimidine glycosylase/DNA-(apurinic or apyrimidinic site) lyase [Alphaproteobacteria bacterium]